MAEAGTGGQAKVDALVALAQRTVFVPTWRMGDDGYRTMVSSTGVAALGVWLDFESLADASMAFGWVMPDGRVAYKEIGARAALGHALANNLLVVVEMGAEHSMEIEEHEMRLLLAPQARSESSGAFAGTGRLQSSLMRAVRAPTPVMGVPSPTGPLGAQIPAEAIAAPPGYVAAGRSSLVTHDARESSVTVPFETGARNSAPQAGGAAVQATFGGSAGGVTIAPLQSEASDALLRALAGSLRGFPEVEWALLASVARGPAPPVPTIAVRVDAAFRTRINDIVAAVRAAAAGAGAGLDVLLLDDAQLMKLARAAGQPFYPWRR